MSKDSKKVSKGVAKIQEKVIDSPVELVDKYLSSSDNQKGKILKLLLGRTKDR